MAQPGFRQRGLHERISIASFILLTFLLRQSHAAYVQFTNCLDQSNRQFLQFVPLNVTASFDAANPTHRLNVTFYGNVTGQLTVGSYPPPNDTSWTDPDSTFGKIIDLTPDTNLYTTLFTSINVLSYTPYIAPAERFCNQTINQQCPLAPSFNASPSDLTKLPGWTVGYDMAAAYAFAEVMVSTKIRSGERTGSYLACINAYVTPDIGTDLRDLLRYLPVGILVLVGIATISAAMFSPWGTWDVFRWTSNFGRDEDILRLVTPGFGDCLQYLQFIILTGSLSLNYPGYYQPVVSRVGWSSLLFNESFITNGQGNNPIVDGLYQYRSPLGPGMDRMTQLIGMTAPSDAWAAMMVWLVVIVAAVVVLTQVGFFMRWIYRMVAKVPPEDLRSKNWYFTVGNVIRITMGYFLLPIVAISMYQFTITAQSPIYTTVLAAVVLVGIIVFSTRLIYMFVRTRPRSYLFDDLQCVLAYGPLYNTYCDDAATFALIPILVNFLRGIAIGAVQASGVAQIVLLAISEIVFVLTVNAFRPYPGATSMNIYHTLFSIVRLVTVLLLVVFVPSLNISGGSRGWLGYIILLIHACVLVFGFLLNAVQTLIEVIARLAGAGGSGGSDVARGGLAKVFGVRQLSKRVARAEASSRQSMSSSAAILHSMDEPKEPAMLRTRSRSISASSTMLLENSTRSPAQDTHLYAGASDGQTTPDANSTFSRGHRAQRSAGSGIINLPRQAEVKDPYYRPPRRNTVDHLQGEAVAASVSNGIRRSSYMKEPVEDRGEGSSTPLKTDDFEDFANELAKTKTDYAVREVDFYYGVRGPALSSGTRKLKTGPADPTGPVSNATGWFKGLLGGRKKEKTKGFEVVRSARAPPSGSMPSADFDIDPEPSEPYRDRPIRADAVGSVRRTQSPILSPDQDSAYDGEHGQSRSTGKVFSDAPLLPAIDSVGGIELPSRVGSTYSRTQSVKKKPADIEIPEVPALPRRSSRRESSADSAQKAGVRLSGTSNTSSSSKIAPRLPFAPPQSTEREILGTHAVFDDPLDPEGEQQQLLDSQSDPNIPNGSGHAQRGSMGLVREHRASDGIIHQPDTAAAVAGRSAEIHGQEPEY